MSTAVAAMVGVCRHRHSAVRQAWLVVAQWSDDEIDELVFGEYPDQFSTSERAAERFAAKLNEWEKESADRNAVRHMRCADIQKAERGERTELL